MGSIFKPKMPSPPPMVMPEPEDVPSAEDEARKAAEAARLLDKKKKKKEAQRAKKMAAKGIEPTASENLKEDGESSLTALEELKAKHMRELQVRQSS